MKEVSSGGFESEDEHFVLYSEYRRQFNAVYEDLIAQSEAAFAGQKHGGVDGGRHEEYGSAQKAGGLQRAIETVRRGAYQGAGDAGMP